MNFSFELINRQPKQKSLKLKVLTEPRQKNDAMKSSSNEFRITSMKYAQMRKQTSNIITSKKTLTSHKSLNRKVGRWLGNSYNSVSINRVDVAKDEMNTYLSKNQQKRLPKNIIKVLDQIFDLGEEINSNFYNYGNIEAKIKILNEKIKFLKSYSCQFYCYCISGLILFQYCSLSLTIFYFDKALKTLLNKPIYCFDCKFQLLAYKYTSKVFLQIRKLKQAKDMAYMYLRKTWRYNNIDEEMCAYDLLGQIQLEEGNIQMSRYFHWRMCHAIKEQKQILHISNQQLDKRDKSQIELTVYENIMTFVKNQEQIVSILSNHFKSEAEQQAKGFIKGKKNKQILMYTHRSSNRVLRNHRILQRKLIDEKQSNQLHFIRPKDLKKLRRVITQFNSFIFDLKRQQQLEFLHEELGLMNQSNKITIQNL